MRRDIDSVNEKKEDLDYRLSKEGMNSIFAELKSAKIEKRKMNLDFKEVEKAKSYFDRWRMDIWVFLGFVFLPFFTIYFIELDEFSAIYILTTLVFAGGLVYEEFTSEYGYVRKFASDMRNKGIEETRQVTILLFDKTHAFAYDRIAIMLVGLSGWSWLVSQNEVAILPNTIIMSIIGIIVALNFKLMTRSIRSV